MEDNGLTQAIELDLQVRPPISLLSLLFQGSNGLTPSIDQFDGIGPAGTSPYIIIITITIIISMGQWTDASDRSIKGEAAPAIEVRAGAGRGADPGVSQGFATTSISTISTSIAW